MHSVLVIAYHLLKNDRPYAELGDDKLDKLDANRVERHPVRRLNALGYSVTLTPLPAPQPTLT